MEQNETTFTSFDFMKIFGIKRGSWNSVKNKYGLDQYSQKIIDGKQVKFVYSQEAFNILKENYTQKIVEEVKENPKMFALLQENETLKSTLDEYKRISNKFETMYKEEKEKKENLIEKNAMLEARNEGFIEENHKLEAEKNNLQLEKNNLKQEKNNLQSEIEDLQKELERLKNRGFFARLFNK